MTGYLLTFGETMALMTSAPSGPLSHASSMSLGIGGSESNLAIGVQRLGVQAIWCGRVGNDPLGVLVEREIRAEGVRTQVVVDDTAPTGLMIKERRTPTTQRVMYYRAGSAGSRLQPTDINQELIAGAAVLHVSGITPALSPSAADTVRVAVCTAVTHGVTVSLDLNFRSTLWSAEAAQQMYLELIPLADVVFAGHDEAEIAVGRSEDPAQLAQRIVSLGAGSVVIKLGADGAIALIDGELHRQNAVHVTVVDTVGAGDAFVAGYLSELIHGEPLQTRLETAVATGAFMCMVPGDWEGLPHRDELHLLNPKETVTR